MHGAKRAKNGSNAMGGAKLGSMTLTSRYCALLAGMWQKSDSVHHPTKVPDQFCGGSSEI
jgi:hypothetical protein